MQLQQFNKEINMDILRKLALSFVLTLPLVCHGGEAVDINAADLQTLMTIKGVGEKRAAAIIAYRDEHGRFQSINELMDVKGVSESLVDKSRESLVINSAK